MCERIAQSTYPAYAERLDAMLDEDLLLRSDRFNIPPTATAVAARQHDDARWLEAFHWGFTIRGGKRKLPMFNARAENVADSKLFEQSLARRRALVPVEVFYVWEAATSRGPKQPHAVARRDGDLLVLAGLWQPAPIEGLPNLAIVTTAATSDMGHLHHRMPVVLEATAWTRWLDPALDDRQAALELLGVGDGVLRHWPVDSAVTSVANDRPGLVEPIV